MPRDNPLKGIHVFTFGSQSLTFQYTWDAIARLEKAFGGAVANLTGDLEKLPEIAVEGLQHHHPGITVEQLKAMQPPIIPFQAAVVQALKYAYFGDKVRDFDRGLEGDGKKKTILRLMISLLSRFKRA